jgi:hypothetical protein
MPAIARHGMAGWAFFKGLDNRETASPIIWIFRTRWDEFVGVELGLRRRSRRNDLVDGIENVAQEQSVGSQSGTASRMR